MEIILTVNAEKKELKIKPSEMLLDVLRRNGYQGVKEGCRQGECGSCTVLVDGLPVTSCIYPAAKADGKKVTTVEALAVDGQLSVLQESFLDEGAVQCGYCTPGMLMSSRALLDRNPDPEEKEIKLALDGNLCRCTGYAKIIRAVQTAVRRMKKERAK